MVTAKAWHVGDDCPNGCGALKPVPPASDAQRAAAANKDNPIPIPPQFDSAPPEQIAELGTLHRCPGCGYQARAQAAKEPAPAPAAAAPAAPAAPVGDPRDAEIARLQRELAAATAPPADAPAPQARQTNGE